jgi:dihydroflavonol-4-reductase
MTTVLVTGASGFIAKHIVRELLENDYSVKATVRSDRGRDQLVALFPDAGLDFVRVDLLADAGWDDAMAGVDVLMHTASPFPDSEPKDPQELIAPAVEGTLRALRAAQRAGVTRVVLTSSCAAIYKDSSKPPMQRSKRENWTDPEGPATSAYEASKTLAERAAWDFVAEHPEMTLTTINPGAVFGVPMDEHYGTSLAYAERILKGTDPAYPNMSMPVVDVRDVARMHVSALQHDTAGQRFPANAEALTMVEMARVLKSAYPDRKISTRQAPDFVVKAMALFVPLMRTVASNLGRNLDVDATDGPRVMGFAYTPARDSLLASAAFLAGTPEAATATTAG